MFVAYFPLALWAAGVLAIGSLPVGPISVPSGSDKAMHFILYGVGGALAARGGRKMGSAPAAWIALLLVILTGAVDELHQYSVPQRDGEIMDWVADASGALFAFVVADHLLKKGPTEE